VLPPRCSYLSDHYFQSASILFLALTKIEATHFYFAWGRKSTSHQGKKGWAKNLSLEIKQLCYRIAFVEQN